ncbi:MAG: hypothetical protein CGW95_10820 [Phenylobacterium zucineum]|nr:MAG: hypothetical protein CGW95_10820 [Phenylobacterium zucineum]
MAIPNATLLTGLAHATDLPPIALQTALEQLQGHSIDGNLRLGLVNPGLLPHWLQAWLLSSPSASIASLQEALELDQSILFTLEISLPQPDHHTLTAIPSNGWCGYLTHWALTRPTLSLQPITFSQDTRAALLQHLQDILRTTPSLLPPASQHVTS